MGRVGHVEELSKSPPAKATSLRKDFVRKGFLCRRCGSLEWKAIAVERRVIVDEMIGRNVIVKGSSGVSNIEIDGTIAVLRFPRAPCTRIADIGAQGLSRPRMATAETFTLDDA